MKKIIFAAAFQLFMIHLSAQYVFFEPKGSFAIEVSLENTSMKRLPMYRNAITSLIVSGDNIIGGTTADEGLTPFIFNASISKKEVTGILDLNEIIPGQKSVRTGFSRGKNNLLYAGTIANKTKTGEDQDGHLIAVKTGSQGAQEVIDLGIPVPGEGIFALTVDAKGTMLYGISFPRGKFFSYSILTKAVKIFKEVTPSEKDILAGNEYVLKPEDYLCKSLVEGAQGKIYGSMPVNRMFIFDPAKQQFRIIENALPEVWGHRTLAQVECWAKSKEGKIYGGNGGDGQLFEVNPVTLKLKNLGKPVMAPGLKGLTFGKDGKLYGISGGAPGYIHLFSYSPGGAGFTDYGNPQFTMKAPGIEQGIDWRGFQLATITSSADGKYIVMGEEESLSQLLVFPVEVK